MTQNMMRQRVLMVTPRYFPYMGGVETHVHEVGQRLAQYNVDVTILTTMPHLSDQTYAREEMIEGMRVVRVPAHPQHYDLYLAPEMYSLIRQGDWDLVHCQSAHTAVPIIAASAARRSGIPYVITFHTGGHSSPLRQRIRSVQWRALRPLLAGANTLIGVSRFERDYFRDLLNLPEQSFEVIPNGISFVAQTPVSSHLEGSLIVSVGRLVRYKGHQHLIHALPYICQQHPDARLLILGAGPYEAELRKQAIQAGVANRVEIRSIAAHDRKAMEEALSQARLVALMSEYEAHPIAVLEALALQRPVLVSTSSGLQELVEQGLVRGIELRSSAQALAAAAIEQMEHPLIPARLALPTWDDCTRRLVAVYERAGGRMQQLAS